MFRIIHIDDDENREITHICHVNVLKQSKNISHMKELICFMSTVQLNSIKNNTWQKTAAICQQLNYIYINYLYYI